MSIIFCTDSTVVSVKRPTLSGWVIVPYKTYCPYWTFVENGQRAIKWSFYNTCTCLKTKGFLISNWMGIIGFTILMKLFSKWGLYFCMIVSMFLFFFCLFFRIYKFWIHFEFGSIIKNLKQACNDTKIVYKLGTFFKHIWQINFIFNLYKFT